MSTTYIYYRIDSTSEEEASIITKYFEKLKWNIEKDNLHLFVTTDESDRKENKVGDDGMYLEAIFEDVLPLAELLNRDITIECTVDTSLLAGEMLDYNLTFTNGKLSVERSDWYIDTSMNAYADYEDFSESFFECTEEEYNRIKDSEFVYIIEAEEGNYLSSSIPMHEIKV